MVNKPIYYFLSILLGVLCAQKINIIGEVYIGEIFGLFLILINFNKIKVDGRQKVMLLLLIFWSVVQMIADIFNSVNFVQSIKGIAAPLLFGMTLLGYSQLAFKTKFFPWFFIGVMFGSLIWKMKSGYGYADNPWKWGLGSFIFVSCLMFFSYVNFSDRKKNLYLLIFCLLFVVVSLLNSSRSMAGIAFLSVVVYVFRYELAMSTLFKLFRKKLGGIYFLLVVVCSLLFIDVALGVLFTTEVFLDMLDPIDALKYRIQANNEWGVILGGRSEILISLQAFFDSPVFGHGSWAESEVYVYRYLDLQESTGGLLNTLEVAESQIDSLLIPTHSYLMGALVWGGLFAGCYWLYMLRYLFLTLVHELAYLKPILVFFIFTLAWSVMFSPFGADARWSVALIVVYFLSDSKNRFIYP